MSDEVTALKDKNLRLISELAEKADTVTQLKSETATISDRKKQLVKDFQELAQEK